MSVALWIVMEMNLANMPDINTVPQVNTAAVPASGGNTQSCKPCESKFASIVNKEISSHEAGSKSENIPGSTQGNKSNGRPEQAAVHTSYVNRPGNGPHKKPDGDGEETVSGAQGKKGSKTDKLLLNMVGVSAAADTNDLQANLINQLAAMEMTDEAPDQVNDPQGQKIPDENGLTAAILNQVKGKEISDKELERSDNKQDRNTPDENALTAALINQIVDAGTDETIEQSGDQDDHSIPGENDLKKGALLYALMHGAVNSTDGSDGDAAQDKGNLIPDGIMVATEKKGHNEHGLKAGALLNDSNNDKKTGRNAAKGKVDLLEELSQKANKRISSEGSKGFAAEKLVERLDEINKNKQEQLKSSGLQQEIKNPAPSESGNKPENIQSGISSELVKEGSKADGVKNNADTAAKTFKVESTSDNSNVLTHAGSRTESGKPAEAIYSVNSAKPAGFSQMLDNIVYVIKGHSKIGVNVEHDVLGKLNININMDKGVLNVHINTSEKVTREFIENNIQHIVDSLAKDGVSVGGFSVGLRNRNGSEGSEGNVFRMKNEQASREIQALDGNARISSMNGLVSVFA
jgi:hypothetical protein